MLKILSRFFYFRSIKELLVYVVCMIAQYSFTCLWIMEFGFFAYLFQVACWEVVTLSCHYWYYCDYHSCRKSTLDACTNKRSGMLYFRTNGQLSFHLICGLCNYLMHLSGLNCMPGQCSYCVTIIIQTLRLTINYSSLLCKNKTGFLLL